MLVGSEEVFEVANDVYVAVGYAASNVVLVQGDGGSIIVDTRSCSPACVAPATRVYSRVARCGESQGCSRRSRCWSGRI